MGDPEIADVNPLTDQALSILGKKIGTTRVSLYGEGKKLVGVFDIEVSYDVSKLREELAQRFPHAKIRVSTANGRVLLSGIALRTASCSTASCRSRASSVPMSSIRFRWHSRSR